MVWNWAHASTRLLIRYSAERWTSCVDVKIDWGGLDSDYAVKYAVKLLPSLLERYTVTPYPMNPRKHLYCTHIICSI